MSRRKRTTEEDDIEEIRKGFEMFDVNHTGIINPAELLEAMDSMNIKEKNPFIYEIIESLNSEKDIKKKGGVDIEDLVSYVYNKVNDTETNIGLRQEFDVINDRDTDTVSMSTFYTLARDYGDQLTEDEIRMLLEKTQMGGSELTFDEFYTIMKGSGNGSNSNSSRGALRNNNNNVNKEVYVKKSNSNISGNNNPEKVRSKKYIYKEQQIQVQPEKVIESKQEKIQEPEPEPEQELEQNQEPEPEPEQVQELEQNQKQEREPDIEQNQEINIEVERIYESPKPYQNQENEENLVEQIPKDEIINQENDDYLNSQDNQEQEFNPKNIIAEEIHQENEPEVNIYQKSQEEILSSPKIINPLDINDSQNMNEFSETYPKNENSEIKYDNQDNSEIQSETSSQMKYSYRRRKIGAAPKYEKVAEKQVNIEEKNINETDSINNGDTKYTKEKETKITNMPDGSKKIEITEKTEVVKEKPYVRGYRYRFGRYKNEEENNNEKEEDKKEEKKEDKKSYYRIRKPRGNDFNNNKNDGGQVTANKEENNEVTIPKRYHRRYRESKTSNNNDK